MTVKPGAPTRAQMSRGERVARGLVSAIIATLLAAVSHAGAGGEITWLALSATSLLALPLCVLLAGKIGSLWRLSLAVIVSQFIYHWSFAGLGVTSGIGSPLAAAPAPLHAEHLAQMQRFVPAVAGAGAADAVMFLAHLAASALTILLLHRGELAALTLARIVLHAVWTAVPRIRTEFLAPRRGPDTASEQPAPLRSRLRSLSAISHRGPPTFAI